MGKYDSLFQDDPAPAPSAADRFRAAGVTVPQPAPAGKYAALFDETAPAAPETSQAESAVRGGLQGATSGFGDELAAGIDTAVSKIPGVRNLAQLAHGDNLPALTNPDLTYAERRDAYRHANQKAEESNPLTYLGGNLAGTAAQTLMLPGAGAATSVGRLAARGAAEGALGGLGYSNAEDVSGMAKDALAGGAVGGAVGGVLGKLTKKAVTGAPERELKDLTTAITESEGVKANAKPAKWVRQQAEAIGEAFNNPENAPIRAAINEPEKAIPLIAERRNVLGRTIRDPEYENLQAITGGLEAGKLVKPFQDELRRLESGGPKGRGETNSEPMRNFLRSKIDDMKNAWSREVTPEERAAEVIDRVVPKTGTARSLFAGKAADEQIDLLHSLYGDALSSAEKHSLSIPGPVRVFDPAERITELEARKHLTGIQTAAHETFGTLGQTPNAQRYEQAVELAQQAQNAHLDAAAQKPSARAVVDKILAYNREDSALHTAADALKTIAEKQAAKNTEGLAAQLGHLHGKAGWAGAGIAAMMGHPAALAVPIAAKVGAPIVTAASRGTNRILADVARRAAAGDTLPNLVAYGIQQGLPEASAQFLAQRAMKVLNLGGGQQQ